MNKRMTCARCGGSLTAVPEGQTEKQLVTLVLDRVPFLACDSCECVYRRVGWSGYGVNRVTLQPKSMPSH